MTALTFADLELPDRVRDTIGAELCLLPDPTADVDRALTTLKARGDTMVVANKPSGVPACLAAQIDNCSKTPERRRKPTTTIIPNSRAKVL